MAVIERAKPHIYKTHGYWRVQIPHGRNLPLPMVWPVVTYRLQNFGHVR